MSDLNSRLDSISVPASAATTVENFNVYCSSVWRRGMNAAPGLLSSIKFADGIAYVYRFEEGRLIQNQTDGKMSTERFNDAVWIFLTDDELVQDLKDGLIRCPQAKPHWGEAGMTLSQIVANRQYDCSRQMAPVAK